MATTKRVAAAEAAKKAGQDDRYIVLTNLHHDGEPYVPDDPITLDPLSAKPLLDAGVVKPAKG